MAKTDNLTDFMTDLANTIRAKKQITGPINAQDFSSEIESISGGTQPTLFEPTVTEGINSIAWSTNANNGAFNVTTVGRIDQTEVTSPLTITSAMDGKTLYITSSADNFNSSDVFNNISNPGFASSVNEGLSKGSYIFFIKDSATITITLRQGYNGLFNKTSVTMIVIVGSEAPYECKGEIASITSYPLTINGSEISISGKAS